TGGSRHTGLAALPYRNIQLTNKFYAFIMKLPFSRKHFNFLISIFFNYKRQWSAFFKGNSSCYTCCCAQQVAAVYRSLHQMTTIE
ncbi:hypothetical protein, partial [Gallintestinimicrobium sp.]|uniref:hypothetical protein n=1 Tax=Gallintestinimicrobium sp. TaxID=2981655 RepID=UPI00399B245C